MGYGTSFNPASDAGNVGTALSASDTAVNSVNLEPEKTRNTEVGTKWSVFDERLALTGAVFHTEKTNARTRNLANDPVVLAGRQRVQGFEVGASGLVAGNLDGVRVLRVTWTAPSSIPPTRSRMAGTSRSRPRTPPASGSAATSRGASTVGGGAQYMDAVFRNTTTDLQVPSYWLVERDGASYETEHAPHVARQRRTTSPTSATWTASAAATTSQVPAGLCRSPRAWGSERMLLHVPYVLTAEQGHRARGIGSMLPTGSTAE